MNGPATPGRLRWAYNTNGLAHHALDDALDLLADVGYDGVALTLDHQHLDPRAGDALEQAEVVAAGLRRRRLGSVVETGARFVLDPRAKHEPTLVTPDAEGRRRRVAFLRHAVDVAAVLGSEAVSFWAGVPRDGVDRDEAWGWLVDGVGEIVAHAQERGVVAAFEPEPGMLVEHLDDLEPLLDAVPGLAVALDTGHCVVTGPDEPADAVRRAARRLGTVTVDGMPRGSHDHVVLDDPRNDVDVDDVVRSLQEVGWSGLVCVELSRDSHRAHQVVPNTLRLLRAAEERVAAT